MTAVLRRRRAPGSGPLLHFPLIADRMAGPHQRRVRDLDELRQERRERVRVLHRRVRRPERVPIVTQLRQAWPFAAICACMGLVMLAIYVLPAPGR